MSVRIANAAGFWGDNLDAPRRLVEACEVDYLTLEYLAELTLSILAHQRARDPATGFVGDFLTVLESLAPLLAAQPQLRIVTNAGGLNVTGCARRAAAILARAGLPEVAVAAVTGDDVLDSLDTLIADGQPLGHLDTGQPLGPRRSDVVSANAYLGAAPITAALADGARIVITGRVADASLAVGPAVHAFGWSWDDWQRLAAATVAGHIIECGAQASGGYDVQWRRYELAHIGYPIAELDADGSLVITKPPATGGAINRRTVAQQLVYEVLDPTCYLTPDVAVDFTQLELAELAEHRVAVRGPVGRPAPQEYKVSIAIADGYRASGQLLVYGSDCIVKARMTAALLQERLRQARVELDRMHVELLGAGDGVPGLQPPPESLCEVVLRITGWDSRRDAVERFAREFAPLITGGPAGLAGYASARPRVQPVMAYWPSTLPKTSVSAEVDVQTAGEWVS